MPNSTQPKSRRWLSLAASLLLALAASSLGAQPGQPTTQWTAAVGQVDELLLSGQWKRAGKSAERTVRQMLTHGWQHPETLRRELAELALYQAIAYANQGRQDDAWWLLDTARNLGRRVEREELLPYGNAVGILFEHPPRPLHKAPDGVFIARSPFTRAYQPFKRSKLEPTVVLTNTAARDALHAPVKVEVVVAPSGQLTWPVLIDVQAHPVVIYAVLQAVRKIRPFRPARLDGKPVAAYCELTMAFERD